MRDEQRTALSAGPLRLDWVHGELRYVRLGAVEVLRRVYVAVRDCAWRTVPLSLSDVKFEIGAGQFHLNFTATHQQDDIDFRWRGTITGEADGTLTFTMDGVAHSDFWRNRIGLCVLHPPTCAGQPCRIEQVDGTLTDDAFPPFIAPHQPCKNMRAITHEIAPGLAAEVRLTGEVFEMEDQRNWTDGSFKTYSTPLELPFPVAVKSGTRLTQALTLTLHGSARVRPHPAGNERGEFGPQEAGASPEAAALSRISLAQRDMIPLPQIGLGQASHGQPLTTREIHRLRCLHLSHLRVDVRLHAADWSHTLAVAARDAHALQTQLELAVFLSEDAAAELHALRDEVERLAAPVSRWLIFPEAEKVTTEPWIKLARSLLGSSALIGAGTNHYFTELNRHRPVNTTADVIGYSLNPQVHATDEDTLREALAAQAATVESARQFLGDVPLAITPVTLKPRFNPHAAQETNPTDSLPAAVDVRQSSLFAAAWTLGSLKYLAESGVASVTYFETTGWRGVLETEAGSPLPELFASVPGNVFPLWHVFADVAECVQAEVVPTISSAPLRVVSLLLRHAGGQRLLLANLSDEAHPVDLTLWQGAANLRRLNADNVLTACAAPEAFRARAATLLTTTTVAMQPEEILTLDTV